PPRSLRFRPDSPVPDPDSGRAGMAERAREVADSDRALAYRVDTGEPSPRTSTRLAGGVRRQGCGGVGEALDNRRRDQKAVGPCGECCRDSVKNAVEVIVSRYVRERLPRPATPQSSANGRF